ncbi:MAG: hypothetical protein WKG01_25990 [Kofleriaceae bacterium]
MRTLVVFAFALVGCTPETSIRPDTKARTPIQAVSCASVTPTVTVMTFGLAYSPDPTTVAAGSIVQFVMAPQHNVTSSSPGLAVGFGATTCLEFPEPGTYTFECASHKFTGTVIVTDGPEVPEGPGAKLVCPSSGRNAFDTYGVAAFVAVNEEIFTLVLADLDANGTTNLGDSFTKIGTGIPPSTSDDLATFKGKLAAFLVWAYGGPASITYTDGKPYVGPQDMVIAHTGLGITSAQYDFFVANIIVPALTNKGVTGDDLAMCFAPVVTAPTFKATMVGK